MFTYESGKVGIEQHRRALCREATVNGRDKSWATSQVAGNGFMVIKWSIQEIRSQGKWRGRNQGLSFREYPEEEEKSEPRKHSGVVRNKAGYDAPMEPGAGDTILPLWNLGRRRHLAAMDPGTRGAILPMASSVMGWRWCAGRAPPAPSSVSVAFFLSSLPLRLPFHLSSCSQLLFSESLTASFSPHCTLIDICDVFRYKYIYCADLWFLIYYRCTFLWPKVFNTVSGR